MGPPPTLSPQKIHYQNSSEWPKMHFKHNFVKCKILSAETPLTDKKKFSSVSTHTLYEVVTLNLSAPALVLKVSVTLW